MKLSTREKNIALVAGLILAGAAVFQLFLWPLMTRISDADRLIAGHESDLKAAQGTLANSSNARRKWKEIAGNRLGSDASAAEGQLLNRVRDAAQGAGLQVQSFKPDRGERDNGFQRVTLRVNASGTMSRLTHFLHALQTSDIPLRVSDLQINARKDGTDDLSIQLGVATIFELPPEPVKTAQRTIDREVTP